MRTDQQAHAYWSRPAAASVPTGRLSTPCPRAQLARQIIPRPGGNSHRCNPPQKSAYFISMRSRTANHTKPGALGKKTGDEPARGPPAGALRRGFNPARKRAAASFTRKSARKMKRSTSMRHQPGVNRGAFASAQIKPDLMKPTPITIPATRPDKARRALRLPRPGARLLSGNHKGKRANHGEGPRKDRINGEEPPLALNSPKGARIDWTPGPDRLSPAGYAGRLRSGGTAPGDIRSKQAIQAGARRVTDSPGRQVTQWSRGQDEPSAKQINA